MSAVPGADAGWLDEIRFDAAGLVPVVAQDDAGGRVLMVAWADRAALAETVSSGYAVYFSRSRARLWRKGEESGHRQRVREIRLDCDADVVLYRVEPEGGVACHTGRASCFYRRLQDGAWQTVDPVIDPALGGTGSAPAAAPFGASTLARLADVIESRLAGDAGQSYVAQLAARGPDAILKKIGEEATETVMAAKDGVPERIVSEVADLWFHCQVMLAARGLRPEQVLAELERRSGTSGLQEKASRGK